MLGRVAEREWLHRQLRIDTDGPARLTLLEGPLGYGKTALLNCVLADLDQPVARLRGDRFLETDSPLAAARPLIEQTFDADLDAVVAEHSFSSIQRHCRLYMDRTPLLLAIDDAQWIDPRSLRLFCAVLPHAAGTVLAYRPGLAPADLIDTARGAGAIVEHLRLGPLGDDAVEQLAGGLPGRQQRLVVDTSAGSPLFARTLVGALLRNPDALSLDDVLDAEHGSSSDALSSVVGAEVRGLEPGPRHTLTAVAVLGSARPDHLVALTGSATVADDLGVLRRQGLLTSTASEPLHPLVQLTVYSRSHDAERAEMHRRAAALPGVDDFARAEHVSSLRAAATDGEVDAILSAAEDALDTDPRVVHRWLSAVDHVSSPRRDLLWARAQVLLGRPERASGALPPLIDDPLVGAEARVLYAQTLRMTGRPADAHEILTARHARRQPELLFELAATTVIFDRSGAREAALRDLLAFPDPYSGAARAFRAIGALNTGDIAAARTYFAGVAEMLLDAPAEDLRDVLEAVAGAAWCAYMLDDFRAAIELAERGLHIARRFGRTNPQPGLGCALAYALIQVGRPVEADVAATDALESASLFRVPDSVAMAHTALVLSAFWQHDTELMRSRTEALRAAPPPAVPWWRRTVESTLARTLAMLGEPVEHELDRGSADVMAPLRYADSATVALFTGDPAAARDLLTDGRELAQRYERGSQVAFLGVLLAGVIADSDPDRATELWEFAIGQYGRLGMPLHLRLATDQLTDFRARIHTSALAVLTAREREIAQQVATGATNQEIANNLFLSRRTVEEHVSNILRKLDIRSRHHVARLL